MKVAPNFGWNYALYSSPISLARSYNSTAVPTPHGEARDRRRDGNILLKCYTRYVLVTTYKLCCLPFYILDSQLPHYSSNLLQLLLSLLPLVQFRLLN